MSHTVSSTHLPVLRVVRGGAQHATKTPPRKAPDSTRRYFINAIRDAFLAMTIPLKRVPARAWWELSRAKPRRQAWGANLLTHLSEAVDAGVEREALILVPELIVAFIDARLAERPGTAASDALPRDVPSHRVLLPVAQPRTRRRIAT